jgi:hypothetical protein
MNRKRSLRLDGLTCSFSVYQNNLLRSHNINNARNRMRRQRSWSELINLYIKSVSLKQHECCWQGNWDRNIGSWFYSKSEYLSSKIERGLFRKQILYCVRSEVVFWDTTPCNLIFTQVSEELTASVFRTGKYFCVAKAEADFFCIVEGVTFMLSLAKWIRSSARVPVCRSRAWSMIKSWSFVGPTGKSHCF